MSTYLVAFMVCDFDYRDSKPETNNVLFRVWARKDAIDQVEFARIYGPKLLHFYEDFFSIDFPLPKQDMAAIPDFQAEAMENWGLITYEERLLLVDETSTSLEARYMVAHTVAHELAHQWFGNLVTMKWWTDLWLNEGLTTYITSLAVENQFPKWNSYNFDVATNLFDVFSMDALTSSHPVSVPIGHPDEVDQIFDAISYSKGSLLVHMMSYFLGKDVFRSGINKYLKRFEYHNAEQDDLWESLTTEANISSVLPTNLSVKDIMDTWTLQTGYPVVLIKREGGRITVSQKRFLAVQPKEEPKGCWWIPLTYSTANNINFNETKSSHWLGCNSELIIDTGVGSDDWIILNNKAAGLYRVNYDHHSWSLIADTLHGPNFTMIHELNRLQLVLDAMSLAKVGQLDYTTAFKVLKYIQKETSYNPWRAAAASLQDLVPFFWDGDKFDIFKSFVRNLLSNIYQRFSDLEFVPNGIEEKQLKALVTKLACNYQVGHCSQDANLMFKAWMSNNTQIPKDMRGVVLCEGIRQGKMKEWNYVWDQYLASNVASEKNTYLQALACSNRSTRFMRFMERTLNSSLVHKQDAVNIFYYVAQTSKVGFRYCQTFFNYEIQRLHDHFAPDTEVLGQYFIILARQSVYAYELQEVS
ncbi:hypothetical protein J6590_019565 [Homalodisca vitripennis]|nr:hypothetical protein J6590_019565 [Homalodisca vitripennis]